METQETYGTETLTTPDALRAALQKAADITREMEMDKRHLMTFEARIACDVLAEKGDDGKLLYSNDMARKAAIEYQQSIAPDCTDVRIHIEELRRALAYAEADAEACRYALRLQIATLTARAD